MERDSRPRLLPFVLRLFLLILAIVFAPAGKPRAQGQPVTSLRLYLFDCATLKNRDPGTYSLTSTASGLVFTGDNDGFFYAFDATTGKEFWRYQTGAPIWGSAPISYVVDGRQWVATTSGLSLVAFALPAQSGLSR